MFNDSIHAIIPVNYTGQFTRNIVFCVVTDIQMNAHNCVRSYRFMDKVIDEVKQEIDSLLQQHSLFSVPIFSVIHH